MFGRKYVDNLTEFQNQKHKKRNENNVCGRKGVIVMLERKNRNKFEAKNNIEGRGRERKRLAKRKNVEGCQNRK